MLTRTGETYLFHALFKTFEKIRQKKQEMLLQVMKFSSYGDAFLRKCTQGIRVCIITVKT
jgi:hypothetical protein